MKIELRDPVAADVLVFFVHRQEPEALRMASFPSRDRTVFTAHWTKTAADPPQRFGKPSSPTAASPATWPASCAATRARSATGSARSSGEKESPPAPSRPFLGDESRRPLWARVAKSNPGSVRVVQKCGFAITAEDKYENYAGEEIEEYVLKLERDDF